MQNKSLGQAPRHSKRQLAAIALLLLLLTLIVSSEIILRFFWQEPPPNTIIQGNHPALHHGFNNIDNFNKILGHTDFRLKPYSVIKEPGTVRIAVLGDSFTFGFVKKVEDTIPYRLQEVLEKKFPDRKFEVLNFGISSYSPIIQAVVYHNLVEPIRPDLILYLYDDSDAQDDHCYSKLAQFTKEGYPERVSGKQFLRSQLDSLKLVRFIKTLAQMAKNGGELWEYHEQVQNRYQHHYQPERWRDQFELSFHYLSMIAEHAQKAGIDFAVVDYPWVVELDKKDEFAKYLAGFNMQAERKVEFSNQGRLLKAFTHQQGLPYYNFTPDVLAWEKSLGDKSRLAIYNNIDGHFTAEGNLRFAKFIAKSINSKVEELLDKNGTKTAP